ncbi:hypothetical protein BJQ92_01101 [Bacillus licheniformis]|nr:hypothetical protein [Bacillus licheniformis]
MLPQSLNVNLSALFRNDISANLKAAAGFMPREDNCFFDSRGSLQHRLYLAKLDPEAADFHLIVSSADKINCTVRKPTCSIPCSIHETSGYKRVFQEPVSGHVRQVQIASPDSVSCNIQFPFDAIRKECAVFIQNIKTVISYRPANRYIGRIVLKICAVCNRKRRGIHTSFRRSVNIRNSRHGFSCFCK